MYVCMYVCMCVYVCVINKNLGNLPYEAGFFFYVTFYIIQVMVFANNFNL